MQNERLRIPKRSWLISGMAFVLNFGFCTLNGTAHAAVPDGYVVRVESATLYLDWGTASGVQKGDRFSVYREGETLKHPVTGEVLGRAEEALGSGTIQTIEGKFSIGAMESAKGAPRTGDRTRWLAEALRMEPASSSTVTTETNLAPVPAGLNELWRSEALEKDAMGLTFADLDGDGRKDIIVAFRKKIQAYRLINKRLEPLASFENRTYRHWLTVDAADVKHDGHDEIFATTYLDGFNRPRVIVLRYENGAFKQVAEFEGFTRVIARADGSRHLYWQNLSRAREMSFTAASEVAWEKGSYKPGRPIDLKLNSDQLFGYAWGHWDGKADEEFAVLEHGERVRIYTSDLKWKSSDVFGGTKNDFSFDDNVMGSVFPRMIAWRPVGGTRDQLLIPTNLPEMGIRLTYLKIYKRSQLSGLLWNDLEMKPAWRLSVAGYLADFGIADVLGESRPQLWVASVGPGDKTVLLSYSLP